jgi:hypothetical protein
MLKYSWGAPATPTTTLEMGWDAGQSFDGHVEQATCFSFF